MKVAKAVVLLALLALIVSACGESGPDASARRLPRTLDLDRVAGMRIPGTPHCKFEAESRTPIGEGPVQDLSFGCGRAPLSGYVRVTNVEARRTVPQEVRCRREEKGAKTVICVVRHGRLLVGSDAHCGDPDSYCLDEDWPRIEAEARAAISRIVDLLEPFAEGATPAGEIDPTPAGEIDPAALPASVDLNRLAGRALRASTSKTVPSTTTRAAQRSACAAARRRPAPWRSAPPAPRRFPILHREFRQHRGVFAWRSAE